MNPSKHVPISDYLFAKAAKKKIPLQGAFELSPVCNFSCKMCYLRKTPGQLQKEGKTILDWQIWAKLGQEAANAGMLYLLLTGGEPFLYPDFRKLYTALHKQGIVLSINSNGYLIDEETVSWLKNMAPSRVNITLYGASRETYGRICGNPDGFDRAVQAIDLLDAAGIPVVINASMIPENQEDLEAIMEFGRVRNKTVRMATYMFPPIRRAQEESDSRFTPEEAAQVYLRKKRCLFGLEEEFQRELQKIRKLGKKEAGEHSTACDVEASVDWGENGEEMRCRAGRSSFWISWEGKMTACGMTTYPLEMNPCETPFLECWKAINQAVEQGRGLRECRNCPKRELCKPCVAMMQAETGSVDKKAPYLCQIAEQIIEQAETIGSKQGDKVGYEQ